jgi:hypothetical protein
VYRHPFGKRFATPQRSATNELNRIQTFLLLRRRIAPPNRLGGWK